MEGASVATWLLKAFTGLVTVALLTVLVLARTELIFFLVAGIVLCFGFSRKIMLITH